MRSKTGKRGGVEILIVEDSATQREQLQHLLEARGYAVASAANGREALELARRRKPTLVLADIVMPELDGYGLCRALKSHKKLKDIPVVLLTMLSDPQDVIRGLECGADNFLRKPYDERYLLSRIDYLLMNRELRQSHKMQLGMGIELGGQMHFISSERQQILDLLISTYQQAVEINSELKLREKELAHSNEVLNGLNGIADGLNRSLSEREVADTALERALALPGIQAGWISLREGESGFRLAGARNLPPALEAPGAMQGECLCRRRLLAGELSSAANILECERLGRTEGDTRGLRYHAAIPLWIGDRTLGVMNLVGPQERLFTEEELKVLYGVGNQVAVALERARLHEHMERLVQERTAALLKSQQELFDAHELLAEADRMETVGRLAAGVAHEVKNPLGIIRLGADYLAQRLPQGSDQEVLDDIRAAIDRAERVIRDLLNFSRTSPFALRPTDIREVIDNAINLTRHEVQHRDITIIKSGDDKIPAISADPDRLVQVFINLLSNAVQAIGRDGTIDIATRSVCLSERDLERARMSGLGIGERAVTVDIRDTGPGIPAEHEKRLFEPFFTTKPVGEGTGLGLAVSRNIVMKHRGSISVSNRPEGGASALLMFRVDTEHLAHEKANTGNR